jgi:hypothetical protein
MCEIDDGERCSVWSERQRRARKDHKCDTCDGMIGGGEIYILHFSVFDGRVSSGRICVECELAREEFASEHGGILWQPESFADALQECIAEGDTYEDDAGKRTVDPEDARWVAMLDEMMTRARVAGRPWKGDTHA